jgi:hypothetical protein
MHFADGGDNSSRESKTRLEFTVYFSYKNKEFKNINYSDNSL